MSACAPADINKKTDTRTPNGKANKTFDSTTKACSIGSKATKN